MSDKSECIFLTYDEAAKRLGIKADSVRRRASARRWPKMQGNDGLARVGVPHDVIPDDIPALPPVITPDNITELMVEIASLKAKMDGLTDRLADTQKERDRIAALLEKALETGPVVRRGILVRLFGG